MTFNEEQAQTNKNWKTYEKSKDGMIEKETERDIGKLCMNIQREIYATYIHI